jgi:hypothetical protein
MSFLSDIDCIVTHELVALRIFLKNGFIGSVSEEALTLGLSQVRAW